MIKGFAVDAALNDNPNVYYQELDDTPGPEIYQVLEDDDGTLNWPLFSYNFNIETVNN